MAFVLDPSLRQYATDRQWELLEALEKHGAERPAGKALGVSKSLIGAAKKAVEKKAAQHGYAPDHDLRNPVPEGFRVKGYSILRDAQSGDAKLIWEKASADKEAQEQALLAALEGFKEDLPRFAPIAPPDTHQSELLTVYPIGDHHFGMLAWAEETGEADYDLSIASRLLCGAMEHLVSIGHGCEECAILVLGDFLHYDGFAPVTPTNKHLLDADSRYPKVVRAAIAALRYVVNVALKKHQNVRLLLEIGNHDPASITVIRESFAAFFEDEPRIIVDTSPRPFHCFTFGKNLIGTHHGHAVKMADLPLLFATDWPEEWGRTRHRYIHTGHVHHKQKIPEKEFVGAEVESHNILAPGDAYAGNNGYRSTRSMKSIVYHREFGELDRHRITPCMLEAAV